MGQNISLSANPILKELQHSNDLLKKILRRLSDKFQSDNEYIDIREAAKRLKRSPATIRRWIYDRKLEGIKLNRGCKQDRYLIPRAGIESLVKDAQLPEDVPLGNKILRKR